MSDDLHLSEEQWKERLTDDQYRILREKGTEAPFSGELLENKTTGQYICAGCGEILFASKTKFDSGSGWPSFTEAVTEGAVIEHTDETHGMVRTEVVCGKCGGHLGHVFPDGPTKHDNGTEASGMRYCVNSGSLDFKEEDASDSLEE
ncbi:MAG: peptide-methionine (R)-S-oxide reductase MsrB [Candidatus Gracilibacteria bacterium]|nr:peptide-methionine (R)-S-oxide reductase MsrB [Candidatus Gracilibacteria bacterium]